MKKIKIEILCDEFYTADSLRELASNIECSDIVYEACGIIGGLDVTGDHYTAGIEEIEC